MIDSKGYDTGKPRAAKERIPFQFVQVVIDRGPLAVDGFPNNAPTTERLAMLRRRVERAPPGDVVKRTG